MRLRRGGGVEVRGAPSTRSRFVRGLCPRAAGFGGERLFVAILALGEFRSLLLGERQAAARRGFVARACLHLRTTRLDLCLQRSTCFLTPGEAEWAVFARSAWRRGRFFTRPARAGAPAAIAG